MNNFWKRALIIGASYALISYLFDFMFLENPSLGSISSNLIGGIFFGITMAWLAKFSLEKSIKQIAIETPDDETILKVGAANHFRKKEGVGGKLVLTDRQLIFKPHKLNLQRHQSYFPLDQIEKLETSKSFYFLENGMTLELDNFESHKFIVENPSDWITHIKSQKISLSS